MTTQIYEQNVCRERTEGIRQCRRRSVPDLYLMMWRAMSVKGTTYAILGWLAVALGLIGIIVPGLPTTAFMILAAFLFAKGSPRARKWLIEHKHFGPHIESWEANGSISPKAKRMALVTMVAVFVISLVLQMPGWVLALQAVCMGGAAMFIWTRPDPTDPTEST